MSESMNLTQLQNYIEVVQLKSFSKAARKLYVSQPAISLQIKKLEQELGYSLIDRYKNKFSVTPDGKRFFRFAKYFDQEYSRLVSDLKQMHQGVTGILNIISSPIIGEFILPLVLSEFKEQNPSIEIKMEVLNDSYRILGEITRANNTMIGFCGLLPEAADIEYIKIGEDEQVLIVYPGHPFFNLNRVTISELMGESLIFRADPVGRHRSYWESLRKAGLDLKLYQPKLLLGTPNGVISAVEAKAGIGLISDLAIKKDEALGLVKSLKIKSINLKRDLFCVYRKDIIEDSISNNFINFIRNYFAKLK
jgi:DNA-binding transcriptional LysR family regulator